MNKKQKILNAIQGKDVTEIPFAFWTHLPGIDLDSKKLAEATYEFYKKYDLDFVKTMNNGMYAIEDYGCEIDYSEIEKGGIAKLVYTPIQKASDWTKIKICDVGEGAIKRELDSVKLLKEKLKDEVPIIFTVFSPITIASKLSKNLIFEHIKEGYGREIHEALEIITESNIKLIKELESIGIDGIFFAAQTSSYDVTDKETYLEFGKKYDLKVLNGAKNMWFKAIHAHGQNIMMEILRDYPIDVFNWHGWETLPDIRQAQIETEKCIMTGIARMNITNSNYNEISNQIYKTISETKGKGLIITPGCVIRYPVNEDTLNFVKNEIAFWQERLI